MINSENGFSLVELLVTIGLIGVMFIIGTPALLSQLSHIKFTRAVREISTEVQAARFKAISRNVQYRVNFTGSAYRLQSSTDGATWVDDAARPQINVPQGAVIVTSGGVFQVVFWPNGTVTGNTLICVRNANAAGDQMTITVTAATGRISITPGC